MSKRVVLVCLSVAALAAPASAQAPTPVSPLTVTPKTGANDPQIKCADQACVLTVLKELKANYPREYQNLMRWCMANESQGMGVMSSGIIGTMVDSGAGGGSPNVSFTPGDSRSTSPAATEKFICDDRFRK